jgi:phosphatidylserine decarboxylase
MFMKSKRTLTWLLGVVILCSFLSVNALAQDSKSAQTKHEPITQQLITMVEHNSGMKRMLIHSIDLAKKINPDKATIPAQTLEE